MTTETHASPTPCHDRSLMGAFLPFLSRIWSFQLCREKKSQSADVLTEQMNGLVDIALSPPPELLPILRGLFPEAREQLDREFAYLARAAETRNRTALRVVLERVAVLSVHTGFDSDFFKELMRPWSRSGDGTPTGAVAGAAPVQSR